MDTQVSVTNDDKTAAKSVMAWTEQYAAHDDKSGSFVLKAIETQIVRGPEHVGEFFPNEANLAEFRARMLSYWAKNHYEPKSYVIDSEQEGTIRIVAKGTRNAYKITADYAVSLTKSNMAKLKGTRGDLNTVRGLVTKVRDDANEYIDQKLRRLALAAARLTVDGKSTKAPPREFWTYFTEETAKLGKRAKKDGICSEAEFKVALAKFKKALEGKAKDNAGDVTA